MSADNITVMDDAQALYVRAAEEIAHIAGESICTHGEFTLCLSGGATPAATYELLATRFHLSVDWKEVQFFWGDERCVPPEDAASNFGMANRTLLSKIELKPRQIHRILGEQSPEQAALAYEAELRDFFGLAPGEFPQFNLVLLGIGEDCHTASLFPQSPALHEIERLAIAVEADAPQRNRITLTPPVFNHAARVMFLASGKNKAQAVKNILQGPRDPQRFPAQIIAPSDGEILWIIDKAAASLLT